ncbi:chalcone isomerase family protein [Pseudodesulfovibrio portus]|uniref:Chalcone isomerase domain-containing protein n=1 Tax=Pseudodesulfovibrio portus TaxID=231439 RepID=A0ABM8AMC7_9BACT|nr:chalcone isomerase family protein [Pseudodesulfovibrio portus]BDQ32534.1 hypothetical protein JCM14722_00760 [Pseudodesulfovibrio portus]
MKLLTTGLAALILTISMAVPALSAEEAGVTLLDSQFVGTNMVMLNGIALREKFFVDVYVAGLYLAEKASDPATILSKDSARLMVMHFVHDVEAKKINDAWMEGLQDNIEPVTPELTAQFEQLASMMEDIKDGEAMSFSYEPGAGTTVMVKGMNKGAIPGKEFADAILATWIGPKPGPGKSFKKALLGQ